MGGMMELLMALGLVGGAAHSSEGGGRLLT